jgi:MYXO-CTERM domain-containing protein
VIVDADGVVALGLAMLGLAARHRSSSRRPASADKAIQIDHVRRNVRATTENIPLQNLVLPGHPPPQ